MIIWTPECAYDGDKWIEENEIASVLNDKQLLCQFGKVGTRFDPIQKPCFLFLEDKGAWFKSDLKKWRKDYREGKIAFFPQNQIETECQVDGVNKKFYTLTLSFVNQNPTDEEREYSEGETCVQPCLDVNAQVCFGWFCEGATYFFPMKTNRDRVLEWIKQPKKE